jgi:hypothetical protein
VRYEILTAVNVNITVIWDVTSCSVVGVTLTSSQQRLWLPATCLTHSSTLKMEPVYCFKTSVKLYWPTRLYIPEGSVFLKLPYPS